MKILHVVDMIDPSTGGGTAERSFQMALALARGNDECTVLCTDVGLSEARRAALAPVELVTVPVWLRRFLIPRVSSTRIDELVRRADAIHVIGHWSVLGARVCLSALKQRKPYVYSPAGSFRLFGRSALLKQVFNWAVGHKIVQGASRCVAITALELEHFRDAGIPESRLIVLPNGVHVDEAMVPDHSSFRRTHGLGGAQVVLFLGRLNMIKGPDLLIEAFIGIAASHPRAALVLAGPDEGLGSALKELVVKAGLVDRVKFIGFVSGQTKQDALAAADLLVVPSRHEAMSLVALEAGVRGTPVLLTDQCGFDEVEVEGGGKVVAVEAQAIGNCLSQMLADPERLKAQGERLRELIFARYTWDRLNQQACELYRRIAAG